MYVCVCKAITDRQVRSAVQDGAMTMKELRRRLDACSCCGKCGSRLRHVFSQVVTETNAYPACKDQYMPTSAPLPAPA